MTIWGVLTTLHTSVATLLLKKSSTGPALSRHSSGNIFAEQPKITCSSSKWVDGCAQGKIAVNRKEWDLGHWEVKLTGTTLSYIER